MPSASLHTSVTVPAECGTFPEPATTFGSIPQPTPESNSDPPPDCPNIHFMQTRSKSGIPQNRIHPSVTDCEPKSVNQALFDPKWHSALQQEYAALMRNHTWDLVPILQNRQAVGCKWVFRVKENADGTLNRYKARLVAKGFHQVAGFDFNETFSSVVKPVTIRLNHSSINKSVGPFPTGCK